MTDYIKSLPKDRWDIIKRLRSMIKKTIPGPKETMSYSMPTHEFDGPVVSFASQKQYLSLYIHNEELLDKYRNKQDKTDIGKSGIRFTGYDNLNWKEVGNLFQELNIEKRPKRNQDRS